MDTWITVPLTFSASLFWLWLIARHDDHEPEPWPLVVLALLLGAAATAGVLWLRPTLEHWLGAMSPACEAFVATAAHEEAWKLLAFLPLLCLRELDEPLDGVVYGAAVGLGFATVENLREVAGLGDLGVLLERASTATLLHTACTGCLGFCLAEAKLRRFGLHTPAWLALGLVIAVGGHGLYDLFLTGDRAQSLVSLLVVLPLAVGLLALKVHWARSRSHEFHP
jgi:RsiW-degrading membrane proteinase PrsW (M82 family)